MQSLVAIPAASLLPAIAAGQDPAPAPPRDEQYKIDLTNGEAAAESITRFFSPAQFAALRQLCDALMPAVDSKPGALNCEVPEFLDFLIGTSPDEVKRLYRDGLDRLTADGVNEASLQPLHAAWTYEGPADPYARFLITAKDDVMRATFNSRAYAAAMAKGRRRGAGGANYFWLPAE